MPMFTFDQNPQPIHQFNQKDYLSCLFAWVLPYIIMKFIFSFTKAIWSWETKTIIMSLSICYFIFTVMSGRYLYVLGISWGVRKLLRTSAWLSKINLFEKHLKLSLVDHQHMLHQSPRKALIASCEHSLAKWFHACFRPTSLYYTRHGVW